MKVGAAILLIATSAMLASNVAVGQIGPGMPGTPTSPQDWVDAANIYRSMRMDRVNLYAERLQGNQVPGLRVGMGPGEVGPCQSNCRVYTTVDLELPDGTTLKEGHLLTPTEVSVLAGNTPGADMANLYGFGLETAQNVVAENGASMLGPFAGIASSIFGNPSEMTYEKVSEDAANKTFREDESESPWLNPFRMLGGGAQMMYAGGAAIGEAERGLSESGTQALEEAVLRDEMSENASLGGMEEVDGFAAMRIDMILPESAAGQMEFDGDGSFTPTTATLWIRPDTYVIAKNRLDGIATADGQTRDFYIENLRADYREVPGSDMYEPYKRIMRMGGVMNETEMAQLEEARVQLAEFDEQMASMPPEQRQMMENMMGGQLDAMRSLANNGVFEYVEIIEEIYVNPDLSVLFATGMPGSAAPNEGGNLVAIIQTHLETLGYEPGNTDGTLDTMTQVAISQYQAETGLTVTGEPSQPLADALLQSVTN